MEGGRLCLVLSFPGLHLFQGNFLFSPELISQSISGQNHRVPQNPTFHSLVICSQVALGEPHVCRRGGLCMERPGAPGAVVIGGVCAPVCIPKASQ